MVTRLLVYYVWGFGIVFGSRGLIICFCGLEGPVLGAFSTTSCVIVTYVVWILIMLVLWLVFVLQFQALTSSVSLTRTTTPTPP